MVHEKIKKYIESWEQRCYKKGIPDKAPIGLEDKIPSYQRIAMCLLKNDMHLTGLGYYPPISKYYSILKRIEIEAREENNLRQLKLNFNTK